MSTTFGIDRIKTNILGLHNNKVYIYNMKNITQQIEELNNSKIERKRVQSGFEYYSDGNLVMELDGLCLQTNNPIFQQALKNAFSVYGVRYQIEKYNNNVIGYCLTLSGLRKIAHLL